MNGAPAERPLTARQPVSIRASTDEDFAGIHRCLDRVARERRWLFLTEAPPEEAARAFLAALRAGGGVHMIAVTASADVVGWCDISRFPFDDLRDVGRCGMGLLPPYRGQGLGERLLRAALAEAIANGIRRVELEVYASNTRAATLYRRVGFRDEGRRRAMRMMDGERDDLLVMGLLLPGELKPPRR